MCVTTDLCENHEDIIVRLICNQKLCSSIYFATNQPALVVGWISSVTLCINLSIEGVAWLWMREAKSIGSFILRPCAFAVSFMRIPSSSATLLE